MTAQPRHAMSYADYLAAEAKSEVKHEYVNGEVYAMAGGTIEHAALCASVSRLIGNAISGKCARKGPRRERRGS